MSWSLEFETASGNVLATCSACPSWREHANQLGPLLLTAADHAWLVHENARRASDLRERARRWQARHADKTANPA
jgi:hypothetical protein